MIKSFKYFTESLDSSFSDEIDAFQDYVDEFGSQLDNSVRHAPLGVFSHRIKSLPPLHGDGEVISIKAIYSIPESMEFTLMKLAGDSGIEPHIKSHLVKTLYQMLSFLESSFFPRIRSMGNYVKYKWEYSIDDWCVWINLNLSKSEWPETYVLHSHPECQSEWIYTYNKPI